MAGRNLHDFARSAAACQLLKRPPFQSRLGLFVWVTFRGAGCTAEVMAVYIFKCYMYINGVHTHIYIYICTCMLQQYVYMCMSVYRSMYICIYPIHPRHCRVELKTASSSAPTLVLYAASSDMDIYPILVGVSYEGLFAMCLQHALFPHMRVAGPCIFRSA